MTNYQIIHNTVIEVRKELKRNYTDDKWDNDFYEGLCYTASTKFIEKIVAKYNGANIQTQLIEGEQAHNPRLPSKYWCIQHTWCSVTINGETWYVDCTSSQFKFLYKDIPEYYISRKKPKWYCPNRKSLKLHAVKVIDINGKIRVRRKVKIYEGETPLYVITKVGLIDIFRYDIWGKFSDIIRKLLGKEV